MSNNHTLVNRIRQIEQEAKTGLLVLEKDGKVIRMYFRNGLIEGCSSDFPQHWLGQYLLKEGYVEPEEVTPLVEEAKRKNVATGEVAVAHKKLDAPELVEVVRQQAFQLFRYAIENGFAPAGFQSGSLELKCSAAIPLQHLLLVLARHAPEPIEIDAGRSIVLRGGTDLTNLPWYPQELAVINELKYPRTPADLLHATGFEPVKLRKILGVLHTLQLVDFVDVVTSEGTAVMVRSRGPYDYLVPEIRDARLSDKLEVVHSEGSFISEQFKTLKVRLSELPLDQPVKVITVSSPQPEDGKSLICANLALSFAKDPGRRVLVIDADLRNPSLHKYLGISPDPGLLGYLQNGHVQPHCYLRRLQNLYVMTAGGIAPNPIELLSLGKMKDLIRHFAEEFDTVIIDATPFAPISDARIVMGLSDGLVMVVRRGKTSFGNLKQAFKVVDPKKLLGVVFNDVKPMLFHTHYNYTYYRYGYGSLYPYRTQKIRQRTKNYLEQ
jgi:protein-tyrosine kinase